MSITWLWSEQSVAFQPLPSSNIMLRIPSYSSSHSEAHANDETLELSTEIMDPKITAERCPESSSWSCLATSKYVAVSTLVAIATTLVIFQPTVAWASGVSAVITPETNAWLGTIAGTGFYQAFSLVFLSEIGDKTFFVAGLLAMKTSKFVSFVGSMAALASMTIISVVIGQIFHSVPTGLADGFPLDDVAACLAFAFFGVKTLKDALNMEKGESMMDEELAEAEEAVDESAAIKQVTKFGQLANIFVLVFAAEFGDRSFLSTIALSAAQNPVAVAAGAVAAHAVATGVAVSGGSYLAKYISEKLIGIIGGTLFLVFAVTTALRIF